jgi:predicted TPR repeat methyltransferase
VDWLRQQRLGPAEQALQRLLRRWPGQPDALQFLGVLRHTQGRSAEAIDLLQRAVAAAPQHGGAWNNLGNVLHAMGRLDDAAQAYERSIETSADEAQAGARANLALVERRRQRQLIRRRLQQGDRPGAAALFRAWLAEEPDNPVASHLLAGCLDQAAPDRASDAYVEQVFDAFAATFDRELGQLDYQVPQHLAHALARHCGLPEASLDIADLGCGTGLCGPLLRPHARRLAGVDLSGGMLAQARSRRVYDDLVQGELVQYLACRAGQFDLLAAADTLIYFGALAPVFVAAAQALRAGGWLIFSVEALPEDDPAPHRLLPTGRYAHRPEPLRLALLSAGFDEPKLVPLTVRTEGGQPVAGWLVSARLGAALGAWPGEPERMPGRDRTA